MYTYTPIFHMQMDSRCRVGGLLSMITVKIVLIIHQASSIEIGFLLFEDKGAFKLDPFYFISSIWVYFPLAFNFSHGN